MHAKLYYNFTMVYPEDAKKPHNFQVQPRKKSYA